MIVNAQSAKLAWRQVDARRFGSNRVVRNTRGSGSELSVQDVRIDRADDDATRQALELLLGAASDVVSRALKIDLMTVVKPTAIPGLPMPARVTRLVVTDVTTGKDSVAVKFDLGVAIP